MILHNDNETQADLHRRAMDMEKETSCGQYCNVQFTKEFPNHPPNIESIFVYIKTNKDLVQE